MAMVELLAVVNDLKIRKGSLIIELPILSLNKHSRKSLCYSIKIV